MYDSWLETTLQAPNEACPRCGPVSSNLAAPPFVAPRFGNNRPGSHCFVVTPSGYLRIERGFWIPLLVVCVLQPTN